jgi:hypothetical protein
LPTILMQIISQAGGLAMHTEARKVGNGRAGADRAKGVVVLLDQLRRLAGAVQQSGGPVPGRMTEPDGCPPAVANPATAALADPVIRPWGFSLPCWTRGVASR